MGVTRPKRRTEPLPHPDRLFVRWAEGWLDLGNPKEANAELEQISRERRGHPDVLSVRWQIHERAQNWSECLLLALSWTEQLPHDAGGWMALARTLHHQNRIAEAYEVGVAKAAEFTDSWQLLYDTACYACLLGKAAEADQFLRLAMTVGDAKTIMRMALEEPAFDQLWVSAKR